MKGKQLYFTSVAVWILLCVVHFIFRTNAILSGPRDGEQYAYTWSYQAVMFIIFRFPLWLIALAAVLFAELRYYAREKKNEKRA